MMHLRKLFFAKKIAIDKTCLIVEGNYLNEHKFLFQLGVWNAEK